MAAISFLISIIQKRIRGVPGGFRGPTGIQGEFQRRSTGINGAFEGFMGVPWVFLSSPLSFMGFLRIMRFQGRLRGVSESEKGSHRRSKGITGV